MPGSPNEPQDSGVILGADGNLYPDPEGYTPSIAFSSSPANARNRAYPPVPGRRNMPLRNTKPNTASSRRPGTTTPARSGSSWRPTPA